MFGLTRYEDLVEPNVFYEPRTAVSPFYVISVEPGHKASNRADAVAFDTRAEAEECARSKANTFGKPYYVLGCVSISSCPPPVKASTRALV